MKLTDAVRRMPWRPCGAAVLFVAAMAALGGGFGLAFLTPDPGPRQAVEGFALMGVSGVLFALTAMLLGLGPRREP